MRTYIRPLLSLALVGAAVAAGLGIFHNHSASNAARADTNAAAPIVINSGDVFTPAPAGSSAATAIENSGILTEQQAVAAFLAVDPEFNPPGTVTYQLGTFAPGPGEDEGPSGEPVWALTYPECPMSRSPGVTGDISHGVCTEWVFLHADTGKLIVAEAQL